MSEIAIPEELKQVPRWVWENWEKIPSRYKQVVAAYRGRRAARDEPPLEPRRILIIGPGGTGKSTLGRFLSGEHLHLLLEDPTKYSQSTEIEEYRLLDDTSTQLIVSPGQALIRPLEWAELVRDITAGKFVGVIITAANGFHSFGGTGYRQHALGRPSVPAFLKALTQDARDRELETFRKLQPALAAAAAKVWAMVLVTKQDLWWSPTKDGLQHYREGESGELLARTAADRGPDRFKSAVVAASFHIGCFRDSRDRVLKKNAAGYDQREQVGSVRALVETLGQMLDWGT